MGKWIVFSLFIHGLIFLIPFQFTHNRTEPEIKLTYTFKERIEPVLYMSITKKFVGRPDINLSGRNLADIKIMNDPFTLSFLSLEKGNIPLSKNLPLSSPGIYRPSSSLKEVSFFSFPDQQAGLRKIDSEVSSGFMSSKHIAIISQPLFGSERKKVKISQSPPSFSRFIASGEKYKVPEKRKYLIQESLRTPLTLKILFLTPEESTPVFKRRMDLDVSIKRVEKVLDKPSYQVLEISERKIRNLSKITLKKNIEGKPGPLKIKILESKGQKFDYLPFLREVSKLRLNENKKENILFHSTSPGILSLSTGLKSYVNQNRPPANLTLNRERIFLPATRSVLPFILFRDNCVSEREGLLSPHLLSPGEEDRRISPFLSSPLNLNLEKRGDEKVLISPVLSPDFSKANLMKEKKSPIVPESLYLETYFKKIMQIIQKNKRYPLESRRKGEEGKVKVSFTIRESGEVEDLKIVTPCSYSRLNKAAKSLILELSPFPPIPKETRKNKITFIVEVVYELEEKF